jgi:hypothetical protein
MEVPQLSQGYLLESRAIFAFSFCSNSRLLPSNSANLCLLRLLLPADHIETLLLLNIEKDFSRLVVISFDVLISLSGVQESKEDLDCQRLEVRGSVESAVRE